MSDDAPFLEAIQADPDDNATRLVYADWLEEQGRPGSEFLRLECRLAALDRSDPGWYDRLAALRVVKKGLAEGWMAAVSRVSVEEINAREREIQAWLRRRVTLDEVLGWNIGGSDPPPRRGLWVRIRALFGRRPSVPPTPLADADSISQVPQWIEETMLPGDELWEYDTGSDSWQNLCGEMGFAIVRDGKGVAHDMVMNN